MHAGAMIRVKKSIAALQRAHLQGTQLSCSEGKKPAQMVTCFSPVAAREDQRPHVRHEAVM